MDNNINNSIADYANASTMDVQDTLHSIDLTLKAIAHNDGLVISQSSLQDLARAERQNAQEGPNSYNNNFRNRNNAYANRSNPRGGTYSRQRTELEDMFGMPRRRRRNTNIFDDALDSFEDEFKRQLFGSASPLRDALVDPVRDFARQMGVNVEDLGKEVGKQMGSMVGDAFKNSAIGKQLQREWQGVGNVLAKGARDALDVMSRHMSSQYETYDDVVDVDQIVSGAQSQIDESNQTSSDSILDADSLIAVGTELVSSGEITSASLTKVAMSSGEVGSMMGMLGDLGGVLTETLVGLTAEFPLLTVAIIVAVGAIEMLIDTASDALGQVKQGWDSFSKGFSGAWNRTYTENAKNLELQKKRIEADITSIREAAYSVIEDSAKKVEQVWDNVAGTIAATQGYDKAGVQDLWSSYAQRLKESNLSSYVSSADIMDKLSSVLQQGLTGAVAEEFAYQATVLNAAIPTQDFFQYAETYAAIAANAIKNGADQTAAIEQANQELSSFASNVLYASREIAGGFTTSLSNASSLFEQSAKIALTSRTGDVSEISGVLTSVSALVGSIAPDLAGQLVDAVVSAATGGNSSQITALRSMAGVGASNTAFLQAFAKDPQGIFESLFRNLSQLQGMSSANYMEVAEALSSVFGVSMDAFARVDFNYLADAIANMNVNNASLEENLELLTSGQTTSTESQLRMQKINEYMIDQGLAYVLDNEVARSIQEHMWQEQLGREIMESTFAVDLMGGALDLLNSLVTSVMMIVDLLSPTGWMRKTGELALTALEASSNESEVRDILDRAKVGRGNALSFHNLSTPGEDLNLTPSYATLLRGWESSLGSELTSMIDALDYSSSFAMSDAYKGIANRIDAGWDSPLQGQSKSSLAESIRNLPNKRYNYKVVSKSTSNSLAKSGDWHTNLGYNALYENYEESRTSSTGPRTQSEADKLSKDLVSSIQAYTTNTAVTASSLDNMRKSIDDQYNTDKLLAKDLEELSETGQVLHRSYYTQAELANQVAMQMASEEFRGGSFEDWKSQFEKTIDNQNLDALLSDYGESIETIRAIYDQQEAAKASATNKARELHEVQFWEDMQHFATIDFPWYMREWERYYIQHEAYNDATGEAYKDALNLASEEKGEAGDAVLALAKALVENNNWQEELGDKIKDPVVQTNVLLSKILLVAESIMQQNNESSIVSVPHSLSALGLGVTNR